MFDYVRLYGHNNETNPCQGAKLHFLYATKKTQAVDNPVVKKIETKMKHIFKNQRVRRGHERFLTTIKSLLDAVNSIIPSTKSTPHVPHSMRRRKIRSTTNEPVFITDHDNKNGNSKHTYYTIYNKNNPIPKKMTYEQMKITYRNYLPQLRIVMSDYRQKSLSRKQRNELID